MENSAHAEPRARQLTTVARAKSSYLLSRRKPEIVWCLEAQKTTKIPTWRAWWTTRRAGQNCTVRSHEDKIASYQKTRSLCYVYVSAHSLLEASVAVWTHFDKLRLKDSEGSPTYRKPKPTQDIKHLAHFFTKRQQLEASKATRTTPLSYGTLLT